MCYYICNGAVAAEAGQTQPHKNMRRPNGHFTTPQRYFLERMIPVFILVGTVSCGMTIKNGVKAEELLSPIPENYTISPTPAPVRKYRLATITAYSCVGLNTLEEIKMNCPSILRGEPKTSIGAKPIPNRTVACDKANLGRKFLIDGIGVVTCNDTGGAIKGAGRFDIYLSTVAEARRFGKQTLTYREYFE